MKNTALILDTETHNLNGLPIQIAYMPCEFSQGGVVVDKFAIFDELFSVGEKIDLGAMAVHHIIESDLIGKPSYKTFKLPNDTVYIIGHNIEYDIQTIAKCGIDTSKIRLICTLALARKYFPESPNHKLSTLTYFLSKDHEASREALRNAHDAKTDILNTFDVLREIIIKANITSLEQLHILSEESLVPTHITFGKHAGCLIANLPIDYVRWMQRQDNVDPNLLKALKLHHGER